MKKLAGLTFLSLLSLLSLTACTTEQAYLVGQQWQANQCSQLPDRQDYDACMRRNSGNYDNYRKEREPFRNP